MVVRHQVAVGPYNVDLAVLSVTTPGVQGEKDTATAVTLVRHANDILAKEMLTTMGLCGVNTIAEIDHR